MYVAVEGKYVAYARCDGDTVVETKDLNMKGSSAMVKVGMKARSIRLAAGDYDIDCSIAGIGAM